ncbi:Origin recognition complex subunit 1 [Candida viswanathii]|uniref:Origin recognition complex subunit 1 n=1 Tax=Candida viswanathii TaxID=5486 RepID=A0A367Y4Z2_9ASCO|nr:Origin recognition complex subunit 1 [Candida viswanathii]
MLCAKGWEHRTEDEGSDDTNGLSVPVTRRGRVSRLLSAPQASTAATSRITLIRQEDGAEFKVGDAIETSLKRGILRSGPQLGIIKQIQFGTSEFILVHVMWFLRAGEVDGLPDGLADENEVFLTPYVSEVKYTDFVRHINVLSEGQFGEIVIDDSNSNNTFLLRRITDDYGHFSEKIDYEELRELLISNHDEFVQKVTKAELPVSEVLEGRGTRRSRRQTSGQTVAPTKRQRKAPQPKPAAKPTKQTKSKGAKETQSKRGAKQPEPQPEPKASSSRRGKAKKATKEPETTKEAGNEAKEADDAAEEDSSEDSAAESDYVANEEDEEEEEIESEEEEIEEDVSDAEIEDDEDEDEEFGKKRKKRKQSARKGGTPSPKRKTKGQQDNSEMEKFYSAVTPIKSIKYKTLDRSSLPVFLSPTKNAPDGFTDPTSQAFKEMKQKLHTSQKLNALPGREDEFAMIYMNLESAVNEGTGCCVYVSGVPGMGKTATIKDVVQQMSESQATGEIQPFSYLELNGLKLLNPNVAYEVLWEHISGHKVSPPNAALLLEEYFKTEQADRKPLIVLMDELDQIATKKQNVMYNFFNWPTYNTSKVIVIAVANTMDLPERVLSNKISSRLGLRRIQFKGYTFQQLGDIISHRLEMITKNNRKKVTISADAIGFASRKVASVSGDARRALTICRRAVEIAEKQYNEKKEISSNNGDDEDEETYEVLISHISTAINETVNSPLAQFIGTLPFTPKLVLASMLRMTRRTGLAESKLGDIISEMKNALAMSTDPKRKKSGELDMMDMLYTDKIFGNDNDNGTNLRVHFFRQVVTSLVEAGIIALQASAGERSKLIQLNVSEEEIVSVLKKDSQITGFL